MTTQGSLLCYNRGCGKRFNPEDNKEGIKYTTLFVFSPNFILFFIEDVCVHHPGAPFFHDAYKGWSCCKKKCTDFTEFLNIKVLNSEPLICQKKLSPTFYLYCRAVPNQPTIVKNQ